MSQTYLKFPLAVLLLLTATCVASAQQTVNIWPGVAPGSENWKQQEKTIENTPVGTVIMNVVTPTLTVYLPEKSRATSAGVIIAPGGAFVALAVSLESYDLARALQERGVAAFVLKYRVPEKKQEGIPTDLDISQASKYGIADGKQAIKVVREHAVEWGITPDKVGFVGFSAGGMVAAATLLQADTAARPNFAALIYGAPFVEMPAIPHNLPPIFMAWAQDDTVAREPVVKFYEELTKAGAKPEAHIFNAGGHGFGTQKHGTTSDHWMEEFYFWLSVQGFMKETK